MSTMTEAPVATGSPSPWRRVTRSLRGNPSMLPTLAAVVIFVAIKVLDSEVASVPAALYGLVMIATAGIAVAWFRRRHAHTVAAVLE